MANPARSSWSTDLVMFDDFVFDWTVSGEDVQDWDAAISMSDSTHSSIDSNEFSHKAKKAKRNNVNDVPVSTKKLMAILDRVKNDSEMKLYQFVNYDKYDSLVYYPHSVTRCYTSANAFGYEKLLQRHYARRCNTSFAETLTICKPDRPPIALTVTRAIGLSARQCLSIFALSHDSHPDCVCNILSTQVIDNQIHATMMYSHTDTPEMYTTAPSDNTAHPYVRVPQAGHRASVLAKQYHLYACLPSVRQQLMAIFESQDNLVFHIKIKVIFTFELLAAVYKIVDSQCIVSETSMVHKGSFYRLP